MINRKPVLILQLRPETEIADSEYACILRYGQLPPTKSHRIRIEKTGIPDSLSLDDYCAIIVGGSPFDISTPADQKSAEQKQVEAGFNILLKKVIEKDFPFLGACSGNGLLGNYLGTPISKKYGEAVGCVPVNITDEGKKDTLLSGLPDQFYALLGHKEACDTVPEGAVLLVTGSHCPVQMFRVGKNVYATQFHPEGDAAEFTLRINTYKNHGYFEPHEAEELKKMVSRVPTPHAQQILARFIGRYALS